MTKPPKAKSQDRDVEFRPDGWQQFERAVDAAVKSGPKHREPAKPKPKRTPGKRRARVGGPRYDRGGAK